jgi:hypothetical protein
MFQHLADAREMRKETYARITREIQTIAEANPELSAYQLRKETERRTTIAQYYALVAQIDQIPYAVRCEEAIWNRRADRFRLLIELAESRDPWFTHSYDNHAERLKDATRVHANAVQITDLLAGDKFATEDEIKYARKIEEIRAKILTNLTETALAYLTVRKVGVTQGR